jgi:phosphoribosylglycinamide formyltransferase-1
MTPLSLAILASGQGSNAKAILDAIHGEHLNATVQCVISNMPDAPVLTMAQTYNIPTHVIAHAGMKRDAHEKQILACLSQYPADYLVLAGYMRLLTPAFLHGFQEADHYRILNIHPSLLPAFPGANGYEETWRYGVKLGGVTVHFIDEQMDHGPIILQKAFPRLDDDTFETFKARGLAAEHYLYPKALQLIAEKRLGFRYDPDSGRPFIETRPHVLC